MQVLYAILIPSISYQVLPSPLTILFPHHKSKPKDFDFGDSQKLNKNPNFLHFNMYKHPIHAFFILLSYFADCMFVLIIYFSSSYPLPRIVHQSLSQT